MFYQQARHLLLFLGQNPTKTELKEIIKAVDINGDGKIDFREFLTIMAEMKGNLKTENNQELIKEIRFDALKRSIPDNVAKHEIEITSEIINSDEIFKIEPQIAEASVDLSEVIKLGEVKYLLNEERRIFKNEAHYFDHPKIGVIISVYDSSL